LHFKRLTGLALLAGLVALCGGCKRGGETDSAAKLNIVCSFLPVYVITQNIVADVPDVSISSLLPSAVGCPHNFALSPVEASQLERADVLIVNGLGMEVFLEDSPFAKRTDLCLIDASTTIDPIFLEEDTEHGHSDHENCDHQTNPHGWVSPFVAADMTRWIGERLSEIDPGNAETYHRNTERYTTRLDSLGQALRDVLSGAVNRRIVTFHSAFDYLARDLGLEVVAVISEDANSRASARQVVELIAMIEASDPVGIFSEPQYPDGLVRLISEETGVPHYVLDPASSGDDDPSSYIRTMIRNMDTFRTIIIPESAR
jgi:ABC-type Zn uptake system ZnuABC Zn-binding protein ZnuA